MAFRTQDEEAAEVGYAFAQLDVRAAAAMLVETVTAPRLPACATISASRWWFLRSELHGGFWPS